MGRVLAANAALGRLVGRPRQELPGLMFDELLSGPSRVLYHSYLQPLLRLHGNVEEVSLALTVAGGGTAAVLLYSFRPANGQVGDDTEVVLAPIRRRRGIEDEMLRIKRAADQSPGLIFQLMQLADGALHFPYVSEAVRRLYGVSPDAAQESAQAVLGFVHDSDRRRLVDAIQAAAAQGRDWSGVFRVTLGDGAQRWHEMHCTPRVLSNDVRVWHGHIADVTSRRELELQLAEREAADLSNRMRGEFLAQISHELRTPLNGIIGFSHLLESDASDNLSETQRQRLGVIRSSGQHLLSLVNQVLEISALEAAPPTLELQALPLQAAIHDAVELVRTQAVAAGVALLPIDCNPALQVRASPLHLRQVLVNLLSNAIKYNRPGGHVAVTARRHAQQIAVAVTDAGPGLSPAQQAQLFQAFNRLGAQNTKAEGTGLGLVITRHLLSVMNGSIEVYSAPGHGSTFTFMLPSAGDAAAAPAMPGEVAQQPVPVAGGTAHGTVLYVEDNPVNVLLMEAIIGLRPGVALVVAQTGSAAVEALAEHRPDLLLLDMHLPDTSGVLLLARLRALDGMRNVPAVAVSAAARGDDIAAALEQGFDGYWTKPLNIDGALAEIDRWLGAGRLHPP